MPTFPKFLQHLTRNGIFIFIVAFLLVDCLLALLLVHEHIAQLAKTATTTQNTDYPEAKQLAGKSYTFQELANFFSSIANRKGAPYAYQVLKVAKLPPNIDIHLLGHVVGDILFQQQGVNGIKVCTQDFRNACSHAIVVGLFLQEGEKAIPEIIQACHNAPGGKGAYTMCFHGVGHGVLAYAQYDLAQTVSLCQKMGTAQYSNREYVECVGGAIMETISGGGHDPVTWARQSQKYLGTVDPLAPCDTRIIPDDAKSICYTYLTPHLFQIAGADLNSPDPKYFATAFRYCDAIPSNQTTNRDACFGGFGKEFTVLAQQRDIRAMDKMTNAQLTTVYQWCKADPDAQATTACITNALESLYWGGENNRDVSIRFCNIISDAQDQDSCFSNLISAVSFYIDDPNYKQTFCDEIPKQYQDKCQT